jgi:hypothetical protein
LKKREELQVLEKQILPEPALNCGKKMTLLRIRMASGKNITRRFLTSQKIREIFNFIKCQALHGEEVPDEFALVADFPRREFANPEMTLESAGLVTRSVVNVEEILQYTTEEFVKMST